MNSIVIASTEADARAASAVEQHHAHMAGALTLKVEAVLAAAPGADEDARTAAVDLVAWCEEQLVPHALAEEATLYAAARNRPEGRLLVDGMLTEHAVITGLVGQIAAATTPLAGASAARTLQVLFDNHLEKENTLLLPLLVAAPDVSVADLLGGMHELIGDETHHRDEAAHQVEHTCDCHEADAGEYPELDARAVPHAIRHATIFGALDGVRPGSGMVLVAPHDPKPLLAQVEQRNPGAFTVEYLEQGPDAWRLAFVRQPV